MKKKINYSFIVLILIAKSFFAQTFEATADRTTVGQYQRFQIYFTFSSNDINSVRDFRAPVIEGLRILGGPNQSSSMQIINGAVTGSLTFSYVLQSTDEGDFTVGPATVSYKGQTYSTQPMNIKVVKGSPQENNDNNSTGVSEEELKKNVFIVATADKTSLVKGEQVTVIYKLYHRLNISSPSIQKLPSYQGFWAEDLDIPKTLNFDIEMYKGQRYRAAVIKKVALFPSQTGNLEITPFELKIPVLIKSKKKRSNDVFDDFFNDSFFGRTETIEYIAKSNSLKFNVDDLPGGAPESFNGAVGDFNFSATLDKDKVKANEAVTFKFNVSGTGNIELLQLPKLELPPGFEVYDPKSSDKINKTAKINGNKSVEYIVVPRVPGVKEIGPVKFSYYDPAKKKYITQSSPKFALTVEASDRGFETSTAPGYTKSDIELLSEDIRFIKTTAPELVKSSSGELIKAWFWIAIILPLLLLGIAVPIKKRQDKLSGNLGLMKFKKAEKAAKNRLKNAKKELDAGRKIEFYTELSLALYGYLEDKLGIQKSDFTIEKASATLFSMNIPEELISKTKMISEKCEFARFAPKKEGMAEESHLYEDTVKLIVDLDSEISRGGKK